MLSTRDQAMAEQLSNKGRRWDATTETEKIQADEGEVQIAKYTNGELLRGSGINLTSRMHYGRHIIAAMTLAMVFALGSISGARADDRDDVRILFTQQDAVQAFDLGTGKGFQIGTATGSCLLYTSPSPRDS